MTRTATLFGALALGLAGCAPEAGNGLWNLSVGGEATLVSADGSDITLETLTASPSGKGSRRAGKTSKAEEIKLPAGTSVLVLAIDGDDARVQIQGGSKPGAIFWLPCSHLEAVSR